MHPRIALVALLVLALTGGSSTANAWTTAKTNDGIDLRWDNAAPVPFRFHFRGSDDLDPLVLQRLTRSAFATWAAVPGADVTFEEERIYVGAAAHHDGPSEVDGQSALFFVEALWPFATEVIALTSVSFAADGEILDADIAFNGADHTFTTVDTGGQKDFLSICTHEVGHFIGLNHPEPDVPASTMTAQYNDGDTFLRDLDPDDEEGLAFLYPCSGGQCLGAVDWTARAKGCSTGAEPSSPGAALLLVGLGLVLAGGRTRRRRVPGPALASVGALSLLVLPGTAASTLVTELSIAELAAGAERVVLADVSAVQTRFDGIVRRTVQLDVLEYWAGSGSAELSLELLGGELEQPVDVFGADGLPLPKQLKGTIVFGVPDVAVGERIVAVLDGQNVRGLAQGLFHVAPDGGVWRDLTGLAFARTGSWPLLPVRAPSDVDGLRAALSR